MAADDPNEKSLFTRIKNCVLMELRRSNGEIKRSPCRERSIWGWKTDKNYTGPEDSGLEKRDHDKLREKRSSEENDDTKNKGAGDRDVSREGKSAGASENMGKKTGQKNSGVEDKEREKGHGRGVERDDSKARSESEKEKSSDQQESCDSKKFKPVRYYIKMQNPEAPVCCKSLKPRKICPPKMRKSQQQAHDSYKSRPTCRCEACSSDSGENPRRN